MIKAFMVTGIEGNIAEFRPCQLVYEKDLERVVAHLFMSGLIFKVETIQSDGRPGPQYYCRDHGPGMVERYWRREL